MSAILEIVSSAATLAELIEPLRSDPARSAVLFDIDGTLAPIVRHAADAHVPEATRSLLIEISRRYGIVGCVSGRRAATARQIVAIGSISYVGNHGGELLRQGATRVELDPELASWTEAIRRFAVRAYTPERQRLRLRIEEKDPIIAFHWRGAPDEQAAALAAGEIAEQARADGLAVHWGRKVLEVRPPLAMDKGVGIIGLLRSASPDGDGPRIQAGLYVGDDNTDLDAFHGLRSLVQDGELGCAVCVAVVSDEAPPELVAQADMTIDGPDGVRELLGALL
jgi:trehalose 6-phosphate phosphatase